MATKYITLSHLTKTIRGLVNKINGEVTITNSKIGDLNNLNTTTKTNLVAAINEAAVSGGGGGSGSGSGTSNYNELINKPSINNVELSGNKTLAQLGINIPTVPTDVSAFNNDAGYLTSYTETDPTVPAWAKATNKPTYTAAEVGALPDTTVIPAAQVQSDWNATSGMGVILNKPTIPAATTVTNTLASGNLIATINGTNIYAPAYTDADGVSY